MNPAAATTAALIALTFFASPARAQCGSSVVVFSPAAFAQSEPATSATEPPLDAMDPFRIHAPAKVEAARAEGSPELVVLTSLLIVAGVGLLLWGAASLLSRDVEHPHTRNRLARRPEGS